jgi:hypothetical protein
VVSDLLFPTLRSLIEGEVLICSNKRKGFADFSFTTRKTACRMKNFLKINKWVYPSIHLIPKSIWSKPALLQFPDLTLLFELIL